MMRVMRILRARVIARRSLIQLDRSPRGSANARNDGGDDRAKYQSGAGVYAVSRMSFEYSQGVRNPLHC